jgi:hypothetical protein
MSTMDYNFPKAGKPAVKQSIQTRVGNASLFTNNPRWQYVQATFDPSAIGVDAVVAAIGPKIDQHHPAPQITDREGCRV